MARSLASLSLTFMVELDLLRDLVADREHRVQAGQRLLEDHRHLVAADPAHVAVGQRQDLTAVEPDLAPLADLGGRDVEQAHDRHGGHALARSGLADDAQRLPPPSEKLTPSTAGTVAVHDLEIGPQVADLEDGLFRRGLPRGRGGWSMSRSCAGPRIECVTQAVADEVDGEDGDDDREAREQRPPPVAAGDELRPPERMLPQVGDLGSTPNPRKLTNASAMMLPATSSEATTMIGLKALGRMWRKMIRRSRTPTAIAASTNSRSRIDRNSERTRRLTPIHENRPKITMIVTPSRYPGTWPPRGSRTASAG